jgi:hypothetical protein
MESCDGPKRPDPLEQPSLTPGGGRIWRESALPSTVRPTSAGTRSNFVSDATATAKWSHDKNGRFIKWPDARQRAAAVQHAMPDLTDAKGMVWRRRPRQLAIVARQRSHQKAVYDNVSARRGRCASWSAAPVSHSSNSFPTGNNFRPAPITGEVYKTGARRHRPRTVRQGGARLPRFSSIHQMDCRNPNELYVAEITAFRVQKIILKPTQPPTAAQAGRQQ